MSGSFDSGVKKGSGDAPVLIERAKNGDAKALQILLSREKPLLYDYLMRMTGEVQRSSDTVEEVFLTMNAKALQDVRDPLQFRGKLIKTVRKFSLDVWNADIALLENAALASLDENSSSVRRLAAKTPTQQQVFDRAFRTLPGSEREVLWLTWNMGWDDTTIAEAMFRTASEVQTLRNQGVHSMRSQAPSLATLNFEGLAALQVPHPVVTLKTLMTAELSQVMRGIRERPVRLSTWNRLVIALIFLASVAFAIYRWDLVGAWIEHFLALNLRGTTKAP